MSFSLFVVKCDMFIDAYMVTMSKSGSIKLPLFMNACVRVCICIFYVVHIHVYVCVCVCVRERFD